MMSFKFNSLIILFIMVQAKMINCKFIFEKPIVDCLIHNQKYSYEYLYASNDIFTDVFRNLSPFHNVYTVHIGSVDDFSKLKWTIERVGELNDTKVTIKSNKGEYLCASHFSHDIFRQRRRIYLKNIINNKILFNKMTSNCEWRIEKVRDSEKFMIWNEWFMEPIYSPTFIYKRDLIHRNVYLWKNKPSSVGSEFKWSIDCGRGSFLLE